MYAGQQNIKFDCDLEWRSCKYENVLTHQIFSLAHDWSELVRWLNIPQFWKDPTCCENYLKDNKHNSLHLVRKYARIFVLGHYLFLVAHSFPRASLSETVRFSERITSADKYPGIISRQMEAIVYIYSLPSFLSFALLPYQWQLATLGKPTSSYFSEFQTNIKVWGLLVNLTTAVSCQFGYLSLCRTCQL